MTRRLPASETTAQAAFAACFSHFCSMERMHAYALDETSCRRRGIAGARTRCLVTGASRGTKPNILVIMGDDIG